MTFLRFLLFALVLTPGLGSLACENGSASEEITAIPPGDSDRGRSAFRGTCIKCHGVDATGIEGSGPDLTLSAFIRDGSDRALIELIKTGRDMNHPLNTTGIAMPPYGANEFLSVQEMADLVAFLRTTLQPSVESKTASARVSPPIDSAPSPFDEED